jgi:hypothetical protein
MPHILLSIILQVDTTFDWKITSLAYWKNIYLDGKYITSSPLRWDIGDWLKCGLVLGTTYGIMGQDEQIRNYAQNKRTSTTECISSIVEPFGTYGAAIALGSVYLIGCINHSTDLKETALFGAESALISGIIVGFLKMAIGRSRPYKERGAWSYYPCNVSKIADKGHRSFPSGHTAAAFSIASYISEKYQNLFVTLIGYTVATMVGLSRIHDDMHWASDVFFGGIIGISVGKTVAKLKK